MNTTTRSMLTLTAVLCGVGTASAQELMTNGGFESGFNGWTRANQFGGEGDFFDQTGILSPLNGAAVPAPPQGLHAAMTDSFGPGAHALYQDIVIPVNVTTATLSFSLYVRNTAGAFTTPTSLDFSTTALSQQARVDILKSGTGALSTAPADVLQNIFITAVGSPLITGYNSMSFDLTSLLAAHGGETLRLRFAQSDNVNILNLGVDSVSLAIPSPSSISVVLLALTRARRRTR